MASAEEDHGDGHAGERGQRQATQLADVIAGGRKRGLAAACGTLPSVTEPLSRSRRG